MLYTRTFQYEQEQTWVFWKFFCLLPDVAIAAGSVPAWLKCARDQKFELPVFLGDCSFYFRNKFLWVLSEWLLIPAILWGQTSLHMSLLRAVGTASEVQMFRDTTLPGKEQALLLGLLGYAIWSLFFLQKRQWAFVEYLYLDTGNHLFLLFLS